MLQRVMVARVPLNIRRLTQGDRQAYLSIVREERVDDQALTRVEEEGAAEAIFSANETLLEFLLTQPALLDELLNVLLWDCAGPTGLDRPAGDLSRVIEKSLRHKGDATLQRFFDLALGSDILVFQYLEPIRRMLRAVCGPIKVELVSARIVGQP